MTDFLTFTTPAPVAARPHVLVVGAGPAGWAAAIAASRMGAQTLLMDRWGQPGGVASNTLVNIISAVRTLHGGRTFPGATAELIARLKQRGPWAIAGEGEGIGVHVDEVAFCMAQMLREAGVELWWHTSFLDLARDGGAISAAFVHNKSGVLALAPQMVVDCTGDGDVAARAGALFTKGRPTDGHMQPCSVMAELAGVDISAARPFNNRPVTLAELGIGPRDVAPLIPPDLPGLNHGPEVLPLPQNRVLFFASPEPGQVVLNMTRVLGCDGTRGRDVSEAEGIARRQMMLVVDLLRRFVPGFANARLVRWSAMLGVRQTRTIVGDYTLTAADVLGDTRFEDAIAFGSYPVDVHNPDGGGVQWVVPERPYYEIPYRCLLPQGTDNLLVAGRAISADHEAIASARIMGTCASTGQAAGVAAALCAERGLAPRNLAAAEVQAGLRRVFDFSGW